MPTNNAQQGSALLAVLWMSAALAAIAFSVSSTVRSEIDRVSTNADGLRTYYLASGSIERGVQWMMWGGDYRNQDGSPRYWEPNLPRMAMHYPSGDAIVVYREAIPDSPAGGNWLAVWNKPNLPRAVRIEMASLDPNPGRLPVLTMNVPVHVTRDVLNPYADQ